jgi:hypothetical protein
MYTLCLPWQYNKNSTKPKARGLVAQGSQGTHIFAVILWQNVTNISETLSVESHRGGGGLHSEILHFYLQILDLGGSD